MATSPAPNAAAPPGMCPGVAVLGGGGGAGGGDGDGSGGGNGSGGDGSGDGNGGNGDGKGAGGCGAGSGGGCPNPAHGRAGGTHAGDPIDPLTGRVYTIPETDLPLVGPLVVSLQRAYSSFATHRDVGLGWGWSHSLAWVLVERRGTLEIAPPFGVPVRAPLMKVGEVVTVRGLGLVRRTAGAFVMTEQETGLFFQFEPAPGRKGEHRLSVVFDSANNAVVLAYDATGALAEIIDSAGRRARPRRDANGRIERFEMTTRRGRVVAYRRYEYDEAGNLSATVDAEGRRVTFQYDAEHRLTEQRFASGREVHFRYDRVGRCVESWVDQGSAVDPALSDDVPELLADGATRAKGMLHVRLDYSDRSTIVYDSRQAKRIDRNAHGLIDVASGPWVEELAYDERGHVAAYSDPKGNVTRYERDSAGRVLKATDPAGHTSQLRYDPAGRKIEAIDELGAALRYAYDQAGNLQETWDAVGTLLRCAHDARGLRTRAEMPNGAVTCFEYDAEANLISLLEPSGRARHFEVDDTGLLRAFTDEEGHRTTYAYDATNALRAVTAPNGAVSRVELDPEGRIAALVLPDGGVWRLSWGGHHCVHALAKPTGEALHFRYDREGNLVRVLNERGEVHEIERDAGGRVVRDRFFDGREHGYRLDATGRLAQHRNAAGERTDIEYDACGRVTARRYDDGSGETFAYDPVGRLVSSDTGEVACTWAHDARGNLVRETCTHDGKEVTVDHEYDAVGQRISTRASVGYSVRYERDRMSRIVAVVLPDGSRIERTLDALGREIVRELPGGGQMLARYDGVGAMLERRVLGPAGGGAPSVVFAEGFACSPGGELVERWTSHGDRERFEYDATGRILRRLELRASGGSTGGGGFVATEQYAYQGTGHLVEPQGSARTYGPGGALIECGDERYRHDGELRRTEKVQVTETGSLKTRYDWNGRGMLRAAVLPDGSRVEHVYDTQGRRVVKRVHKPEGGRVETRFTWAGDDMIHESKWSIAKGAEPVAVHSRAYVYDDDGAPLAHQETLWTEAGPEMRPWVHYALGPGDMPELLVGGDGAILARLRATVWGQVTPSPEATASTPLRFPGQYADDETGLHYNRYRYYDPAAGLYVSPDPIGLMGGLGAFEYAESRPHRLCDARGLKGRMVSTVTGEVGTTTSRSGGAPRLHTIVQAALPKADANGFFPSAGLAAPGTCAEPQALSAYLFAWEDKHGPLDPNNKADVKACLSSITSIDAKQKSNGGARSPCPNCSQMLANLMATYGAPDSGVIQPGTMTNGTDVGNFEPPRDEWKGSPQHLAYPEIGR
ncbi:MAG: RHS repeat-associated core domain-containing protein [Polyangiaceae bacterium]